MYDEEIKREKGYYGNDIISLFNQIFSCVNQTFSCELEDPDSREVEKERKTNLGSGGLR